MGAVTRIAGAALLLLVACGPPPFQMSVTFVGPVELEPGAEVRYQGVQVGEVAAVALRQDAREQPALVEVSLTITDPGITLREKDLFEIVTDGLLGEEYVRVTPATETSRPIEQGASVAGLPPFVTRVRESMAGALDSLGTLAQDQSDALLEALAGSADEEESPPEPTR